MAEPDGARCCDILDRALRLERLTVGRRVMITIVAVLAVPVWLLAIWPHALPAADRRFVLALFGVLVLLAGGFVVREWRAALALDEQSRSEKGSE